MKNRIGVFYTCFTEKKAVKYSLEKLFEIYPDIPVYLVSDGGSNYDFLNKDFPDKNIKVNLEEDTRGVIAVIDRSKNYYNKSNKKKMIYSVETFLRRLNDAIEYCDCEYLLVMEPDVLVRGKININDKNKFLGSRVNKGINKKLIRYMRSYKGAVSINNWGATPALFKTSYFKKILELIKTDQELIERIYLLEHRFPYYDMMFAILFGFIGIREEFNPDITECFRNPNWENSSHPLLHQFRKYYPSKEEHASEYATEEHQKLTNYFKIPKKKILFCTNCQGNAIYLYLKNCIEFEDLYDVEWIENWIMLKSGDKQKYLEKLKICDIFIYQPLKIKHGELSTETENGLKSYLKKECKLISFPYIYSSAFWPFFHHVSQEDEFYPGLSGQRITNKEIITDLIKKENRKMLYERYEKNNIDFKFKERFDNSIKLLKNNEEKTDIKVSDYILQHYKNKRLFLTKDHPTKYIIIYCANEILKLLKINHEIKEDDYEENYHNLLDSSYNRPDKKWPVTKQCSEELGLNFFDKDGKVFFRNVLRKIN
jgi:hypothetical protein